MKGINFITDEQNHKKAVVIDMDVLEDDSAEPKDLLDGILAESRKQEVKVTLDEVVANLKNAEKLP